jgi:hypothetical protein
MPHHHTPANHDQDRFTVIGIDRAIKGARYPTTKEDLALYAQNHNASADVVTQIRDLPGDRFESEADVTTAFSRTQSQGKNKFMP